MKLAATLPKGGLAHIADDLVKNPVKRHIVIGVIDVAKLTTNMDSGDVDPTIRFIECERVTDADSELAQKLARRAVEERTGQMTLPIDMEQAIDNWLINTATGEIIEDGTDGAS